MIPIGVHFVHYRPRSRVQEASNSFSPSAGFFISISTAETIVKRWDITTEQLCDIDGEETARYAIGVRNMDFDRFLGPYPREIESEWNSLSSFITTKVRVFLFLSGTGKHETVSFFPS